MATLLASVRFQIAARTGPALSARSRAALYVAGHDVPRVPVQLDTGPWGAALGEAFAGGVPIPPGALPASGSDGAMSIYQPSTDTYWDFFQLQQALHFPRFVGGATADPGGVLDPGAHHYKLTAINANGETTAHRLGIAGISTAAKASLTIRWAGVEGATAYRVYRGSDPDRLGLLATLPADARSFADDGSMSPSVTPPPTTNGATTPGQWRASYGGRMTGASTSPGYFRDVGGSGGTLVERFGWGAAATSLPLAGGMITKADLQAGRIDHALSLGLPNLSPSTSIIDPDRWAFPAQRTDGKSTLPAPVPEGARLRLDPALDLDALALSPFVRMLAEAAQRHGAIVHDGSAATVFYGEDPSPYERLGEPNFYDVHIPGRRPGFLDEFPWEHLQLVEMRLCDDPRVPCPAP